MCPVCEHGDVHAWDRDLSDEDRFGLVYDAVNGYADGKCPCCEAPVVAYSLGYGWRVEPRDEPVPVRPGFAVEALAAWNRLVDTREVFMSDRDGHPHLTMTPYLRAARMWGLYQIEADRCGLLDHLAVVTTLLDAGQAVTS